MALKLLSKSMSCIGMLVLALLIAGCKTSPSLQSSPSQPELKQDARPQVFIPEDPPVTPEPVPQEVPQNPIAEENNIYFSSGSTRVDSAGEQKLRSHALRLAENRKTIVTLIGLTDDQGSRSFNLVIAERRIEAVAKFLRAHGVLKNQIRPYALGSKTPDPACRTPVCRDKMRRVVIDYGEP